MYSLNGLMAIFTLYFDAEVSRPVIPTFDVGNCLYWTYFIIWSSGGTPLAFDALVTLPGVGKWN